MHAVVPEGPASTAHALPDIEMVPLPSQTKEVSLTHALVPQLTVFVSPLLVIVHVHAIVPPPSLLPPFPPSLGAAASDSVPCVEDGDELDEQARGDIQTATTTSETTRAARETDMSDIVMISQSPAGLGWVRKLARARRHRHSDTESSRMTVI